MTTGSTVQGTLRGLRGGFTSIPQMILTNGNPNGIVSQVEGSGLAWDKTNFYMNLTGSTWVTLGSVA